jgi:hypothetical protein
VVPDLQEEERDDDYDDDGPKVDELRGQNGGVTVGEYYEVVPFDVEEGQDKEAPAVEDDQTSPLLEAVLVDGVGGVDQVQEDVVEERLEGGDRGSFIGEE